MVKRSEAGAVFEVLSTVTIAVLVGLIAIVLLAGCEGVDPSGLADIPAVSLRVETTSGVAGAGGAQEGLGGAAGGNPAPTPGAGGIAPPAGAGGVSGALSSGVGGAPAPAPFSGPRANCDPVSGQLASGGGRCGGGTTCDWTCAADGQGGADCTGETLQGRSCVGGPCGWTTWSTGSTKLLGCAFGSTCWISPGAQPLVIPAGSPGATTSSAGVCRAYCASSADCGGASCDGSALPCAPPGGGLCPVASPRNDCERT